MKLILTFLIILIGFNTFSQPQEQIDSLINEICTTLKKYEAKSKHVKDTLEDRIIFSFISQNPLDSFEIIWNKIYEGLERSEQYKIIREKSACKGTWENLSGQTTEQKDSIIDEMCKTFNLSKGKPDSIRLNLLYENHIVPLFSTLVGVAEIEKDYLARAIDYRFKRNCKEFRDFYNLTFVEGWENPKKITKSELSLKECKEVMNRIQFFYISDNDTVAEVSIENNRWIEKYKVGSYAEFKLKWVKDCEFELEFVESNRFWNKNYNNPGDKYRCIVIDKKENYYDIMNIVIDTDEHVPSKLHF